MTPGEIAQLVIERDEYKEKALKLESRLRFEVDLIDTKVERMADALEEKYLDRHKAAVAAIISLGVLCTFLSITVYVLLTHK